MLALLLRVWGIAWALPNASRLFSYHPDESVVVSFSLRLNPFLLLLDPGFYNYGSLSLLVNAAFLHAGEAAGLLVSGPVPGIPSAGALLTARLVTAFLGAGTCLFLYGAGLRLYSASAGLAAALLYAVAPLAVQHGHFATVDVPATFWLSGALYFAARHLKADENGRTRDLFWAGLWSGLAAAAKYNAGLVLLAGAAAWWLRGSRAPRSLGRLVAAAVLGFVVGCPGVLLNPNGLLAGLAYEAQHVRGGHGLVFVDTLPAPVYHVLVNLRWGLGWPLLLVTAFALASAYYCRRRADLLLLAFAVPYFVLIGFAQVKFARYTLPLLPPLLLLVGSMLSIPASARRQRVETVALVVAAGYALLFSVALNLTMTRPDPRDRAAAFLRSAGVASVGFPTGPWYYSPPLGPLLAHPRPDLAQKSALDITAPRLVPALNGQGGPVEWDTGLLLRSAPAAVALSEFEYADALRVGHAPAREYIGMLTPRYPNRRTFANPVEVLGIRFTNVDRDASLPVQHLPHDMLYTNPTQVIFSR